MRHLALAAALLLPGCAQQSPAGNNATASAGAVQPLSPGTVPVRIGEAGAGLAACGTRGMVVNLSPGGVSYLPLRAAPFAEGQEVARLGNGAPLYLCTRSIDQKWQGVVVPPDPAPADGSPADRSPGTDCGVSAPVAAPAAYAGPCRSGWVASDFVRISPR